MFAGYRRRDGRHVPRNVADVVGAAAALLLVRHRAAAAQAEISVARPIASTPQLALDRVRERLVRLAPRRQPDRR